MRNDWNGSVSHPVHQAVLQIVVPEAAETVKGINGDVRGTPWFQQKRRMGRAIQWGIDKTAQTGQRLTTSQIIYLFSEHFPPVMFPVSSRKRALRFHIPVPAFLHLVTRASSSIHPALTHWWTEIKIRFPNCSNSPLFPSSFFYIMPSKIEAPGCFLKQEKSEKTCAWKDDAKFEGKLSIAKSCGYTSPVLWYFDFVFYFFLALASKSKKQYEHRSMRTVEKLWKIERRDC